MRFFLLLCFLSATFGWAPRSHPSPGKLPKAMDSAEKALRFQGGPGKTHAEDTTAFRTDECLRNRKLPWIAEAEEEEDCEHTFFDRIGGDFLCWAYLMDRADDLKLTQRLTDHLTSHPGHEEFDEDCEEVYYDDTGDALCWVI